MIACYKTFLAMARDVIYNGYECIVLRVWDEYWYDLQTKKETEKGFIEQFLSVEANELRAQGNVL